MTYPNAPIVEAVLDVQISDSIIIDPSIFEDFAKNNLKEYPISNKKFNVQFEIKNNKGKETNFNKSQNLLGYLFSNIQNNRTIQFRLDGFSYNMLRPYSNWEDFSKNGLLYLEKYLELVKPNHIVRIGLRYINRFDFPLEDYDYSKYIKYLPPIPNNLSKKYNNLFWQMEIPSEDKISNARITQTFESIKKNTASFIIDIDVYQNNLIELGEDLKSKFECLRNLKNDVFEDLITEECKELFK